MGSNAQFCISVLLLCVALGPDHVAGVWKCDGTTKGTGKSAANCRPGGHKTTSAADTEILKRALLLDPAAELKYHTECKEPATILAEAEAENAKTQMHSRLTDLQDCTPTDVLPRPIGIEMFQYGYNILTDKYTDETAHTPVLNIRSTTQFRATVNINNVCHLLPDAFATAESLGFKPKGFSMTQFDSIGRSTTNSHREEEIDQRKMELSLDVSIPGVATIGAGFSQSSTTKRLKKQENSQSDDSSHMYFIEGPYFFDIFTAMPTNELIQEWKRVYREATKEAYYKYFDEFGTHYFLSGLLGGKMTATFSTKKDIERTENSNSEMRASCVTAKVSASYMEVSGELGASYCNSAYKANTDNMSAETLMYGSSVICEGGDVTKCPTGLDGTQKVKFAEWRATIPEKPIVLSGTKRWITQLVEHVLTRSGISGPSGDVYKMFIAKFAMTKKEDDSGVEPVPANIANNSVPFMEFQALLHSYLTNYLTDNTYCNLSPDNCPTVYPKYWIEGISHAGWGDWLEELMCPEGQFIKAVARRIEKKYLLNGDSAGLVKLVVRCGQLHSGEVNTGVMSSGSSEGWGEPYPEDVCLGDGAYLKGFRLWSLPNQNGFFTLDNRGATDIQFTCIQGGNEILQPSHPVVDSKDRSSEKMSCPTGYGICGIQSKVEKNQGEGDDTAVNNVRFACCHLD